MSSELKVIIADDEVMVCVVIQDAIDFQGQGMMLCGIANDGVQLLTLIKEHEPDIVITDISMPGLSGLDVIRETRDLGIDCKFVIISGYSQFEYARSALKYRVDDYILKPINPVELNDTLAKLRKLILAERSQLQVVSETIENNQKNTDTLRKTFMLNLVTGHLEGLDLQQVAWDHSVRFQDGLYLGVAIKIDLISETPEQEADLESVYIKIIGIMNKQMQPLCHDLPHCVYEGAICFALNCAREQEKLLVETLRTVQEQARGFIDLFLGMKITIGIGSAQGSITRYKLSLDEARTALYYRMTLGMDRLLYYPQVSKKGARLTESERQGLLKQLERDFESFDVSGFVLSVNQLFDLPNLSPEEAASFARDACSLFWQTDQKINSGHAAQRHSATSLLKGIYNATSLPQLKQHLTGKLSAYMRQQIEMLQAQNTKPVREAIAYMQKHFAEPISLEQVAEQVALSAAYFSSVFKKETGENYIDYLNRIRIESAKEQLRTTGESILGIASAVGIGNPKYFAKLFKKYVGLKPSEYRNIYG